MKISTSVLIALITIICVFPFAWFMLIGKQKAAKTKNAIKDLIKSAGLKTSPEEFWNYNFIGIDTNQNTLVFIKVSTPENQIIKIDLKDIKTCQINKIAREYKVDKKTEFELQKLNLELVMKSHSPTVLLNFYDIEDQLSESFEMDRAEKWRQLINSQLSKSDAVVKAA